MDFVAVGFGVEDGRAVGFGVEGGRSGCGFRGFRQLAWFQRRLQRAVDEKKKNGWLGFMNEEEERLNKKNQNESGERERREREIFFLVFIFNLIFNLNF